MRQEGDGPDGPTIATTIKDAGLLSKRRQHLVRAAARLIAEKGFAETSVNEIAEAAQLSIGALYRYVKSKQDILYLVCEDIYAGMDERLLAAVERAQAPAAQLAEAMTTYFEAIARLADYVRLMYREYGQLDPVGQRVFMARELAVARVFERIIREGVAGGVFHTPDPWLVANDIVMLAQQWALKRWAFRNQFDADTFREGQIRFVLASLTANSAQPDTSSPASSLSG